MSSPSFVGALKVTVLNALTPAGAVNMFVEMYEAGVLGGDG